MVPQRFCLMVLLPIVNGQHCFQRKNILVIKNDQDMIANLRPVMSIWRRDVDVLYHHYINIQIHGRHFRAAHVHI